MAMNVAEVEDRGMVHHQWGHSRPTGVLAAAEEELQRSCLVAGAESM
jgi:hypothetical protein